MAIYKCKMCGGDLNIGAEAVVVECDYCGTTQTVPTADNEKKLNLFNRANRLRLNSEFDKAAGIYESIIAEFPEEAEAYWGLCLCNYGIEYVDDPATGNKVPTCHRASFEKLANDENFNMAMEYADVVAQKVYRDEAREIDRIMEEILSVSKNEKPYDVFICYKETDDKGERTIDSVLAQDVYDALTAKGLKVFFARITLEDKLGKMYEPYIFAALNSAKVMLAIGTKYEHFHAVWVKNEWSRFLKIMAKDKSKALIPCYKDMDAYDMPDEFKALQAQDMGKIGFMQDLVRGVSKITGIDAVNAYQQVQTVQGTTGALTKRGYIYLEDGDFQKADSYFERALDENPEDGKAYVGKLLAELRKTSIYDLEKGFKLDSFKNFNRALRFSDGEDKIELEKIKEKSEKNYLLKCFVNGIKKYSKSKVVAETKNEIKRLSGIGTVDSYRAALSLAKEAFDKDVVKTNFDIHLLDSINIKILIMELISERMMSAKEIKNSPRFKISFLRESNLVETLEEMISDGSVEKYSTQQGDLYCGKGVVEKIQEQMINKSYNDAMGILRKAQEYEHFNNYNDASYNYRSAMFLFEKLDGFKDSEARCHECRLSENNCKRKIAQAEAMVHERKMQHNNMIRAEIATLNAQLENNRRIYEENKNKIFGSGAKFKNAAASEISRLEELIKAKHAQLIP